MNAKQNLIEIKGEAYKVGFSFGAIRNYELYTGKTVDQCQGTWENLIFFWCTLRALNENFSYTFEQFVETLDEAPELLSQFFEATKNEQSEKIKKNSSLKALFVLWMLFPLLAASPVLIPVISILVWIWTSMRLLIECIKKVGKKRD